MPLLEALRLALQAVWSAKLRSFFTLLGIIVSVGFLVVVVAVIQGMNAYVKENLTGAVVGTNAFQVRRSPIAVGLMDDEQVRAIAKRPLVSGEDAATIKRALPDAEAVALQSGWPTPISDVSYRDRTVGNVLILGVTPPYQIVQDYRILAGVPLTEPDLRERRPVAVIGYDIVEKKGRVLGQSFDAFLMLPLSTFEGFYGRRKTTVVSVKMASADAVDPAMVRAEEAMRVAHRLRPGEPNDFTVDKADALVAFWRKLTRVLFTAIPAVVCVGIVVGGIVIMNIMLMSVTERTREIGLRKSLGARRADIRRQFLSEAIVLSTLGGLQGVLAGWGLAFAVSSLTPLPARITLWSVAVALALGGGAGVVFGVFPATRAARLDPITALRAE